jgi:hypothetical protein
MQAVVKFLSTTAGGHQGLCGTSLMARAGAFFFDNWVLIEKQQMFHVSPYCRW